jgi:hypothetical protein
MRASTISVSITDLLPLGKGDDGVSGIASGQDALL